MNRSRNTITALILALLLIAVGAHAQETQTSETEGAQAQPKERNWTLRFGLLIGDNTGNTSVTTEPGSVNVNIDTGGGGFFSFERKLIPLLGLEMGLLGMGSDINVSANVGEKHCCSSNVDILAMSSLTLGLNIHFVNDGPVVVYAGPLIAFNHYAGVSVRSGIEGDWPDKHNEWSTVRTETDSEITWGAKLGADFLLGEKRHWSIGCSVTYMDATYDFERLSESGATAISLDPLMFSVSAGFRF